MSAGSFHKKETINQITPPIAKSKGTWDIIQEKPAFIKVPTINTAVASHFKLLPVFTFVIYYLDICQILCLLHCSLLQSEPPLDISLIRLAPIYVQVLLTPPNICSTVSLIGPLSFSVTVLPSVPLYPSFLCPCVSNAVSEPFHKKFFCHL